jgi:hypothetical protein
LGTASEKRVLKMPFFGWSAGLPVAALTNGAIPTAATRDWSRSGAFFETRSKRARVESEPSQSFDERVGGSATGSSVVALIANGRSRLLQPGSELAPARFKSETPPGNVEPVFWSASSEWGKHPIGSGKNTHIVLYDFSKRLC